MKINNKTYAIVSTLHKESNYILQQVSDCLGNNFLLKKYFLDSHTRSTINIEYEYKILSKLNISEVVRPINIKKTNASYEILTSYSTGKLLREYIDNSTLEFSKKLDIAKSLIDALSNLHNANIVHQNISPEKILYNPNKKKVTFIDLSHAIELSKNKIEANVNLLTNKYFSPEQTGKTNTPVDNRTDFYNLGLIFSELFVGYFPFKESNLVDLVYSHVAKSPKLDNFLSGYPALGSIIVRLLNKNPETRYQNCKALQDHFKKSLKNPKSKLDSIAHIQDGVLRTSQTLYGRKKEKELLWSVADKARENRFQLVLVSGYSGIGKSSLIKEIKKPICQDNGHYFSGKFEQLGHKIPLNAFIQVSKAIVKHHLSGSSKHLRSWVEKLKLSLGDNLKVITNIIPELLNVVGEVKDLTTLQATEEQNRFVLAFTKFIQACCDKEPLVVLFLDDMQWADSTSLLLLESICASEKPIALMVICAYRKNEVLETHPFQISIDNINKHTHAIHHIELKPLNKKNIVEYLCDSLSTTEKEIESLANIVIEKTLGNPFFANQLLNTLYDTRLLYFEKNRWRWNINAIEQASISDNVVELVSSKISTLPEKTQSLLKIASAIGNIFSLNLIREVASLSTLQLISACSECIENGFICLVNGNHKALFLENISSMYLEEITFKFSHDKIQQASYELLDINERPPLHLKIGKMKYHSCSNESLEKYLFDITLQVNQGIHLMDSNEREIFSRLNLRAGIRAQRSGSYEVAKETLSAGCKMVEGDPWTGSPSTIYQLHIALLKTQYLCTHYQDASNTSEKVLRHCSNLLDKIPVYTTQILNYTGNNQMAEAVDRAVWVVRELGLKISYSPPNKTGPFSGDSLQASELEIQQLDRLPIITDESAKAALSILVIAGAPAYFSSPENFEKICFTMLRICTEHGNTPDSAYAYAYAGIMCSGKGHYQTGYQYCQLGLKILNKHDNKTMKPQIYEIFNVHVRHWCDPVRECLPDIREGIKSAQEVGGIEFASYNAAFYCSYLVFVGDPLPKILADFKPYWYILRQFGQEFCISYADIWICFVKRLIGSQSASTSIPGEHFSHKQDLSKLIKKNNLTALFSYYQSSAFYCLLEGDYNSGYEYAEKAEEYVGGVTGMRNILENCFCFALCSARSDIELQKKKVLINRCLHRLIELEEFCQNENAHKILIIKAELSILEDDTKNALLYNSKADRVSLKKGYLQDHVIAKIQQYNIYRHLYNDNISLTSFDEMLGALMLWGAENLAKYYLKNTPKYIGRSIYMISESSGNLLKRESFGFQKEEIDILLNTLASLPKEMDEKILQEKLLFNAAKSIGAEKAILLSIQDNNTSVLTSIEKGVLNNHDNNNTYNITYSNTVINYCYSSGDIYHCNDAQEDQFFTQDEHIMENQVHSVLCLPFKEKTGSTTMIYMENNLSPHMFSQVQTEWVSTLIRQSVIALENARLYSDLNKENEDRKLAEQALAQLNSELEKRVNERTSELNLTNRDLTASLAQLKEAQSQLIESEKMASLGGLVAGIAHEINTPIGTGLTSISYLENQIKNANKKFENGSLTESDFKSMMDASRESSSIALKNLTHASDLIRSFKRVAVDQTNDQLSEFDLIEDIKDILTSLKPKYKHLNVNIDIKGFESLIVLQTPGSIAQIITNLVTNALNHAFVENHEGMITIEAYEKNNKVTLIFSDNGLGMNDHILSKIFDPFFTTKRGSGGSGLGMNIVYNLVQQALNGKISVASTVNKGSVFTMKFPQRQPEPSL